MSPLVKCGDVDLFYESKGDGPDTVLLIAGLGAQLTDWHDDFVTGLVERGFRVIRFDNRDAGLSTHLEGGPPDTKAIFATGDFPYLMKDLAGDAANLLKTLGVRSAYVFGHSMGAMIAQQLAIDEPELIKGAVFLSGNTGQPFVGAPTQKAMNVMAGIEQPPTTDPLEAAVWRASHWASWKLGVTPEDVHRRMKARFDHGGFDPDGAMRHTIAIGAAEDRTAGLAKLSIPASVLHGIEDPLVQVDGGEATAAAIPGAELTLIRNLRHDMPRAIWPQLYATVNRVRQRAMSVE